LLFGADRLLFWADGLLFGRQAPMTKASGPTLPLVLLLSLSLQAQAPTPDARADALLAQMTLDEKIAMVSGTGFAFGSGYAGRLAGVERLGIPPLYLADGPNGVGNGSTGVTAFPAAIAAASTWDTGLVDRYGAALGREQRGKGHTVALTPTINIVRLPQWGRTFETFSEDPWLAGRLAAAQIAGIQRERVIATVKHFAANNQETERLSIDVQVPERVLREIYFPAFRAAVTDGGAAAVMCAYNRLNGTFACEHPWLLTEVLRGDWGFDGFVMSDWFATHSTAAAAAAGLDVEMPGGRSPIGEEYFGESLKRAVEEGQVPAAVLDGMVRRVLVAMARVGLLDAAPPGGRDAVVTTPEHQQLARDLAAAGTVLLRNEASVLPLTTGRIRTVAVIGDAAHEHPRLTGGGSAEVHPSRVVTPLAGIEARAGADVTVTYARGTLGTGRLPELDASAVAPTSGEGSGFTAAYYAAPDFGGDPVATRVERALGGEPRPPGPMGPPPPVDGLPRGWSARWAGTLAPPASGTYRFSLAGAGAARLVVDGREVAVLDAMFPSIAHGLVELDAARSVLLQVEYRATGLFGGAPHLGWQPPDSALLAEAVAAATNADAAIVFVDDVTTEGSDRATLALPGDQDRLIAAVAAANPRTVIVLQTGGPVLMPWLHDVAAVVAAWYPGQESGDAIASVLFGDVNPAARLPITFPARDGQGPGQTRASFPGDGTRVQYEEGLLVGYRWYDARDETPLFPFGHGLSYTTFRYDQLELVPGRTPRETRLRVRVRVTNTGERAGGEVVQLYVGFPPEVGAPPRQLKGFQKVTLASGQSRFVTFELDAAVLSYWDERARGWASPGGSYRLEIGASSRDIRVTRAVRLPEAAVPARQSEATAAR
jgi:beta-glucosidase